MTSILKWVEKELLEKALQIEADEVSDGPSTNLSFLKQLPLQQWGFTNCPAIPYWADEYGDPDITHIGATVINLNGRAETAKPTGYHGLSTQYTIDGQPNIAYEFLYDEPLPPGPTKNATETSPAPNELTLNDPTQFTLPWTIYQDVYSTSLPLASHFAATLTDHDTATERFWPTIANFGLPYNLLVLAKVDTARARVLEADLGLAWSTEGMAALQQAGLLYEIDMSILASLPPMTALDNTVRFTPGTVTVLKQDPTSKALTPIAITVATTDGLPARVYTGDSNAWCYALQAAKTSITVWGIWLGHVYHWHIVTAAMQMTMYNTPSRRPQALLAAGAPVAVAHRLRFRPPHVPVGPDLATHAGARLHVAPQAARQVRRRPTVHRRRPAERAFCAWVRRQRLHREPEYALGCVSRGGEPPRDLGDHRGVRDRGRQRPLPDRRRRGERHGPAGVDEGGRCHGSREHPRHPADRPDARRAHGSAHEHALPNHRARGRKHQPGGEPGAVVRVELPAVPAASRAFPIRPPS